MYNISFSLSRLFFTAEPVAPRPDLVHRRAIFHAQELHACRLRRGLAGLGHSVRGFGRNIHGRRGVNRNGHIQFQVLGFQFPVAHNPAVERIIAALHPRQIADDCRLDDDLLEAGRSRIGADAERVLAVFAAQVCHLGGVQGCQRGQQQSGEGDGSESGNVCITQFAYFILDIF
jgi:hypothetical protein